MAYTKEEKAIYDRDRYAKKRDEIRRKAKEKYKARSVEEIEADRQRLANWYAKNKTQHLQNIKKWKTENPERTKELNKKSRSANLETDRRLLAKRYAKRREELKAFKESIPCADCKQFFPSFVMDFDHVRGEKLQLVGKLVNCVRERMFAEIEKCELVCSNCHRIRTAERKQFNHRKRVTESC